MFHAGVTNSNYMVVEDVFWLHPEQTPERRPAMTSNHNIMPVINELELRDATTQSRS